MFAKIFILDGGQVLVCKETAEDGAPGLRFTCQPPNLDFCHTLLTFEEGNEGVIRRDALFEEMDNIRAFEMVDKTILKPLREDRWMATRLKEHGAVIKVSV